MLSLQYSIILSIVLISAIYILVPYICTVIRKKEFNFSFKTYQFINRFTLDKITNKRLELFGFSLFCGRQGGGKTYSAINYAVELAKKYNGLLVSNTPLNCPAEINYQFLNRVSDLKYLPKDFPCYIIVLDEIQTLFDSKDTDKDFYTLFCQQRKRNVKIIGTAQVFERVALKLREQVSNLYYCRTFCGCLTRIREYLPEINNSGKLSAKGILKLNTRYIVQCDYIRNIYNTYYKI